MSTHITISEAGEAWQLLISDLSVEVLRVEAYVTYSEVLNCWLGFTPNGLPVRKLDELYSGPIYWHQGAGYILCNAWHDRLEASSELRERVSEMRAFVNGALLLHNSHPPQAREPYKWSSDGIPRVDAETERLDDLDTPRDSAIEGA